MNKRIAAIAAAAIGIAVLAGCGGGKAEPSAQPTASVNAGAGATVSPSPSAAPTATPGLVAVKVYDGDANIEKLVERTVNVPKGTTAELVKAGLAAMAQKPESGGVPLAAAIEVRSISQTGSVLKLDVAIKDEGRLGSGGELLLVDALKKLFFQFSDIDQVEITVGGEKTDSLMGHVELPYPMKRTD